MANGKLIALEGIDGCGKSTQSNLLLDIANGYGWNILKTYEPTDGLIGKLIRSEFLSGNHECDIEVLNLLMRADRLDHCSKKWGIRDLLDQGHNIISDRYVLSDIVYSCLNKPDDQVENHMNELVNYYLGIDSFVVPDVSIIIDVFPEECIRRINSRNEKKEIYEDLEKLEDLRRMYKKAAELTQLGRIVLYDANGKFPETVSRDLWDIINQ